MFHEEYTALCNAGVAKNNLLKKNPLGYFISSMVAGMFISFGSMVAFVLGQSMDGNGAAAAVKLIQSIAFASALSLVVMAGAELFTGNNLVMAAASLRKKVSWADTVKLWCILIFMTCGFEHSIADMSIIGIGVANGGITVGQYLYTVLLATVGNIIGGAVFVAVPYHVISKEK